MKERAGKERVFLYFSVGNQTMIMLVAALSFFELRSDAFGLPQVRNRLYFILLRDDGVNDPAAMVTRSCEGIAVV